MRFRPTAALVNALLVTTCALGIGLLQHRVDLLVLAVPGLVFTLWAVTRRPRAEQPQLTSLRRPRVPEGGGVAVLVTVPSDGPGEAVVAWPGQAGVVTQPRYGVVIGPLGQPQRVVVEPERWGRYDLGEAVITANDELGGWVARARPLAGPVVSVAPRTVELVGPDGVARPVGTSGVHRSHDRGDGSEFADLREFRPGDRVRRINWRVTARRGHPYVVTTYLDEDTDVLVVADTSSEIPSDVPGHAGSLDHTMRALAAITRYYSGMGDRVAVHDTGAVLGSLPPGSGARQARIVMDAIARADVKRWTLLHEFHKVRRLRSGTLVFVLSPLLSDDIVAEISRLRQSGADVIVVDTFPADAGTVAGLDRPDPDTPVVEAVALRRLDRAGVSDALARVGVPTARWEGPASLGGVLQAMAAAKAAPRLGGGR